MRPAILAIGALIGAVALMLLPLAWVKILGSPTSTAATDPLNLITSAATVMGGILVAGGLVALLGSIATFLAIEDKVKSLLDKEVEKVEVRTYGHIQVFYQATRTIHLEDWREALWETKRMLEEDTDIPGARFELAERLFTDVVIGFRDERDSEPVTRVVEMNYPELRGIPFAEARDCLKEARKRKEGPQGRATALLALLAGLEGDWTEMWDNLVKPVGDQSVCVRFGQLFRKPYHLAMLCAACTTEDELKMLGRELRMPLPASWDRVERSLDMLSQGQEREVSWWVWRSGEDLKAHPDFTFPRTFKIELPVPAEQAPKDTYHLRVTGLRYDADHPTIPTEWRGPELVPRDYLKTFQFVCPARIAYPNRL